MGKKVKPPQGDGDKLAQFLTVSGVHFVAAAIVREALETEPDPAFESAFSKTKTEAREFLECYELCSLPYWGAAELAGAIVDPLTFPDPARALRAVELAQKAGELPEVFTPKAGVEWAMSRQFAVRSDLAEFVGLTPGHYGKPLAMDAPTEATPAIANAGTAKKWTPERLRELASYRQKHGIQEAAKRFGISKARIRALLPGEKKTPAKAAGYSVFSHRMK